MILDKTAKQILTINTGSSSLKIAVYECETRLVSGEVERIGAPAGRLRITDAHKTILVDQGLDIPDHGAALEAVLTWLKGRFPDLKFGAIGHRVVHGGVHYRDPQRVTPELIAALQGLISLAPDHMPQAIEAIVAAGKAYPDLPQVACFDTSFHRSMPRLAQIYPLPRVFEEQGIIRYGFHGLSYEYIMGELRRIAPEEAEKRIIIAHLGNGASMAAIRNGASVDTTMGFTPAGGLMMGTRPGDLDPGVLLYLSAEKKTAPAALNDLVNKQAGLLGVSGISADMRDLLAKESADARAAEAIALFCYLAKKQLGALAAVLGGLNTLVFTGGIGEHAAAIRQRIGNGLEFLGVRVDSQRNEAHAAIISPEGSAVTVRVMRTDEDLMIAQHTKKLVAV